MIRGAPQLQLCLFKILCYILGFLIFELFFKDFVNIVLFNWCMVSGTKKPRPPANLCVVSIQ